MTGKRVTRVVLPIVTAGERKLLLTQTFATDHFVQLVQNIRVPSGCLATIIDGQGRFVARNLHAGKLVGTPARPELVVAMGKSQSGRIRHRTSEKNRGVWCLHAFFAVRLGVRGGRTGRSDRYAARKASLVAAAGLLAATFGAIGMAVFFGRLHVRSTRAAVKAAIELGNGIPPGRLHPQVLEVNELHAALHAAGEQLVQAQAYRKHAETERECLLESEQRARLMAEQQNSAKDQFLAMLGHKLRNPLAPISTAAQLLKLQSSDPNQVRYASDVITRQVDHMNSLLGDMLDVSRVTRGLVSLSMSLAQVVSMFLKDAGGHRISTYYDGATALKRAAADRPDVFILALACLT